MDKRLVILMVALISLMSVPQALAANPGHGASAIASGTFESGDYTFPNDLYITNDLFVGPASGDRANATIWFGRTNNTQDYLLFNESEGTNGRFVFSKPLRVPGASPAITFYDADDPGNTSKYKDLTYDPDDSNIQLGDAYVASFGAQDGNPPSGRAFFLIGTNPLASGAGPGTFLGFNTPGAFGGDLMHLQVGDTSRFRITNYGDVLIRSGTMTTNAPVLNLRQGWNDGATSFNAIELDITDTASAAASDLLDLQVGGASRFRVQKDGTLFPSGDVILPEDPDQNMEAATKQYVDNEVAGASSNGWNDTGTQVKLLTSTDDVNTTTLFIDNTAGKVGIGTTSFVGNHVLEVDGQIGGPTFSGTYLDLTSGNAFMKGNNGVNLQDGGLYINQSGAVGIGTTDPGQNLEVFDTGGAWIRLGSGANNYWDVFSHTDNRLYLRDDGATDVMVLEPGTGVGILYTDPVNALDVDGAAAIGYAGTLAPSDSLIVSGSVGIGTSNPGRTLHLNSSANNYLRLETTNANGYSGVEFKNDAQTWTAGVNNADAFVISNAQQFGGGFPFTIERNANANALYIDINGNTGLGTTSPGSYRLYVNGSQYVNGDLVLAADPDAAMEAATKQYVDNNLAADVWVNESGDTMSGTLDMGSNLVTNIGAAGTDFTSGGGLGLAGALSVTGEGTFANNLTLTNADPRLNMGSGEDTYLRNPDPTGTPYLQVVANGQTTAYFRDNGVQFAKSTYPTSNNSFTLGTASNEWSNLYAVDGSFSDQVTVGRDPTTDLEVATKVYVDNSAASAGTNESQVEGWVYDGDNSIGQQWSVTSSLNGEAFLFTGSSGTTGERDMFTISDPDIGGGSQDESSSLKIHRTGAFNSADDGSSVLELTYTGGSPQQDKQFYALGRLVDEGAVTWGVELASADIWTTGSMKGGAIGTDCGGTGTSCFNTPQFVLDGAAGGTSYINGSLGIGQTSASHPLDVSGIINTDSHVQTTAGTSGGGVGHYEMHSSGLRFSTGLIGTEDGSDAGSDYAVWRYDDAGSFLGTAMVVDRSSGNVGIGFGSPTSLLEVQGAGVGANLTLSNSDATITTGETLGRLLFRTNDAQYQGPVAGIHAEAEGDHGGVTDRTALTFYTMDATAQGPLERMRIDRSGNLVIGDTTAGAKLDVNGDLILQSGLAVNEFSGDGDLTGASNSTVPTEWAVKHYVDNNAGAGHTGTGTNNYVTKWTGSNSMGDSQIFDDGTDVGIGTAAVAGGMKLQVAGAMRVEGSISTDGSNPGSAAGPAIYMRADSDTGFYSPSGDQIGVSTAGTQRMFFDSDGSVSVGTGSAGNATGVGDLYVTSDIEYDGNLYGAGADIAENIPSDADYAPGTVLVIGEGGLLTKSTRPYDGSVAGVVTTDPAIIMGKDSDGVPVALAGRVPVKVSDEGGEITPGDLLTTSSTPGTAMRLSLLDPESADSLKELKAIMAENEKRRAASIGKALGRPADGLVDVLVSIR